MIVNWSFSIATLNYLRVRMHHVPYIYLYLSQFGWIMPGKMFPLEFGRTVHKNQLFWCQKGLITSCFDSTDSTKIPCPPICLAFHFYQRVPPFSQLKQDSLLSNPSLRDSWMFNTCCQVTPPRCSNGWLVDHPPFLPVNFPFRSSSLKLSGFRSCLTWSSVHIKDVQARDATSVCPLLR